MDLGLGAFGILIEEGDGSPSGFCTKIIASNSSLTNNGDGSFTLVTGGGVSDHGALTGLSDDDHSQYGLLVGRSGGQTLIGGTGSGDGLTLNSSSHATKGLISLGSTLYVDEVNNRAGIGVNSPTGKLQTILSNAGEPFVIGNSVIGSFEGATTEAANKINAPSHGLSSTAGDLLIITSSSNGNEGIYYIAASDATYITIDGSFLNTVDNDIDFTVISGGIAIEKEDGSGNQYIVGGFLKYRSLFMEYGTDDVYARPQLHLKTTDSIIRIGSFQGDGDGIDNNQAGDGIIIYGANCQGDTFDADNFGYARIKSDRFGLYNDKDGSYAGYLFRIDLSSNEFYLKDNSGNTTFDFTRSTGALTITGAMTAGSIYVDGYIYRSTGDSDTAIRFIDDRVSLYCGARVMADFIENGASSYLTLGIDGSNPITVQIGRNSSITVTGSNGRVSLKETGSIDVFSYEGSVADDGTVDLPDNFSGFAFVNFDEGADRAICIITDAGAVTFIDNSANVVNTDSDGQYCVFDNGTKATVKNRIGSAKNIKIIAFMG